jgi:hypothetical protein
MNKEKQMTNPQYERRKGPDLWIKLLTWAGLLSCICLVAALFIAAIAKPEAATFFDRFYNLRLRQTWNLELMRYLFYMLLVCSFSSIAGLIINSKRKQRKTDHIRVSLIVMLCISIFGLIQYFLLIHYYN